MTKAGFYLRRLLKIWIGGGVRLILEIIGGLLIVLPWFGAYNWEPSARVGALVLVVTFLYSGYHLYSELTKEVADLNQRIKVIEMQGARIRLEPLITNFFFSPGLSRREKPWPYIRQNPQGFCRTGVPAWGSIRAAIWLGNLGKETGRLVYQICEAKTVLPHPFDVLVGKPILHFHGDVTVLSRGEQWASLVCDVPLAELEYDEFIGTLRNLAQSDAEYKVVVSYSTHTVDGNLHPGELAITGSFAELYKKALEYRPGASED